VSRPCPSDGDCIGSQLGLALALQALDKTVVCWNEDRMPQKLAFLDTKGLIQPPSPGQQFDCVIATDSASFERLGKVASALKTASCSSTSTTTGAIRAMRHQLGLRARTVTAN